MQTRFSALLRQFSVTVAVSLRNRYMRTRRHSWTLRFETGAPELRRLSKRAREGFEYARELARNSQERRHAGLRGGFVPELLSVAELAARDGNWPPDVSKKIKEARVEIFGRDLGERAIFDRIRRREELRDRRCKEPGCEATLPGLVSAARGYCDEHHTGAARARRSRRAGGK
jgi:hypothetical protein